MIATEPRTPAERMAAAVPRWMSAPFADPVGGFASAAPVPRRQFTPRRQYDQIINLPPRNGAGTPAPFELESVGTGFPVYLSPEESGSEDHRVRSIKSAGGEGSSLLVDAEEEDLEIQFKTLRPKDDTPITVESGDTSIRVGGNGFDATIRINSGGSIVIKDGLIESAEEGVLGGTGSLKYRDCNDQLHDLITWNDGQVITDPGEEPVSFQAGECQTETPGS